MSGLNWTVPPECQGQIVEVSYASDGEYLYRRTLDRSDREVTLERVAWDGLDVEYEPWNRAPLVDASAWTEVAS